MSWLDIPQDSPFSLANIPFGIISTVEDPKPRPAIAVGQYALDLNLFSKAGGFEPVSELNQHLDVFSRETLNAFAALGQATHRLTRQYLQRIFTEDTPYSSKLRDNVSLRDQALIPVGKFKNHLPMQIGDYTDFYAGLNHAFNVGVLFRGAANALQPNYKHIPVGYHGRASTVVVSGTPVKRPKGQILLDPTAEPKIPVLAPSKKLDIELELAALVCKSNGSEPIPVEHAKEYIFGVVLMNDWSARDIQAWEYVPLGPFLSKSFNTTISPWVVLTDALEPFLVEGLESGDRGSVMPYLRDSKKNVYDIRLEVDLVRDGNMFTTTRTSGKNLLWSFQQMLAHHTINGCSMQVGDLLGSGTISGTEPGTEGSFLEQSENGKKPLRLSGAVTRTFLEDGDEIVIRGVCGDTPGSYVGFGDCRGVIVPG